MTIQIHWLTHDLDEVPVGDVWLSPREISVLAGLHVPKRRSDWRLGRWTTKSVCQAYRPDTFPEMSKMDIIAAEDGGPDLYFSGGPRAPVSISISHSNARGFSAVAPEGTSIGCDLELIEKKSLDFFEDYFTAEEISFCRRAPEDAYPISCYLIWSAKESCLKVLREGLRRDTRSIGIRASFPAAEGVWTEWTGLCSIMGKEFCGWWRKEDGFMYTVGSDEPNRIPVQLKPV